MARTILIIDDNPLVRDVVRCMLEGRGYEVFVAEDGAGGMELFNRYPVDTALVDVDMPRGNGIEVCRALCSQASGIGRKLMVWLMTGVMRPEVEAGAAAVGARGVLPKPFTTDELVTRVESGS